jgi:hypothetical protein
VPAAATLNAVTAAGTRDPLLRTRSVTLRTLIDRPPTQHNCFALMEMETRISGFVKRENSLKSSHCGLIF